MQAFDELKKVLQPLEAVIERPDPEVKVMGSVYLYIFSLEPETVEQKIVQVHDNLKEASLPPFQLKVREEELKELVDKFASLKISEDDLLSHGQ